MKNHILLLFVILFSMTRPSRNHISSNLLQETRLTKAAEVLFYSLEGQSLLRDMNVAGISVLVGDRVYGTGKKLIPIYVVAMENWGEYHTHTKQIFIDEYFLYKASYHSSAALLAHEIQHALDYATGRVCNTELRAELRESSVKYRQLYIPESLNC